MMAQSRKPRATLLDLVKILVYFANGRIPGSNGYRSYREAFVMRVFTNQNLMQRFATKCPLPPKYGVRLDERVIEYPWLFSRLSATPGMMLDAGSVLNHRYLLDQPVLRRKTLSIYTLAPEHAYIRARPNVSYIYGDLRQTIFCDSLFDEIVCLSTLEHIGMDNELFYTKDPSFRENNEEDFSIVVRELNRILKPGGRLFVTVPYGRAQNYGWQQQFDRFKVAQLTESFSGTIRDDAYYRYDVNGWQISDAATCDDCEYHDRSRTKMLAADYASAARAVVCLEFVKGLQLQK